MQIRKNRATNRRVGGNKKSNRMGRTFDRREINLDDIHPNTAVHASAGFKLVDAPAGGLMISAGTPGTIAPKNAA